MRHYLLAAIQQHDRGRLGDCSDGKTTDHLTDVDAVVGWDEARDAELVYAECPGSPASHFFHGRPIWEGNRKTRGFGGK